MMTLTFVSNYINHHQIPVSDVLYERLGAGYHFVQVQPMEMERSVMGWSVDRDELPYLLCYYEEPDKCRQLIMESDMVVFGGVEEESYIQERLSTGRPVIRYSERLYREGQWKAISPRGLIKKYHDHTRYRHKNVYLLCAGAYTASDFSIIRAYPEKKYRWGYFPEFHEYDIRKLINNKRSYKENTLEVLFAGRFLPLKHPEYALDLAEWLKDTYTPFHLTMAGGGEMDQELRVSAVHRGLENEVTFTGYKSPGEIRKLMEQADIFLMTSNHLEGWGAVIPEAMNSGCAVVANASIGAVPFLLKQGYNGMVYREDDKEEFIGCCMELASDRELRESMGIRAYETVRDRWNPAFAAESLIRFAEGILTGAMAVNDEGPLSPAPVIWPWQGYDYVRRAGEAVADPLA